MSQTLALLIDAQERLVPAMHEPEKLVDHMLQLSKGLQYLDVLIVATEQYPKGLGVTIPGLMPYVNFDYYYDKTQFDAVIPEVQALLDDNDDLQNIVLYGMETHVCVYQTALTLRKDYPHLTIYLVEEAVGSRNNYHKKLAIQQLRHNGVQIVSIETLLFLLMRDATHANFKNISQLIK